MNEIAVYECLLGDVEDAYIIAGLQVEQFMESELGVWLKEHAVGNVVYDVLPDERTFGHLLRIRVILKSEDEIYYRLRWQ